jgi:hypothetical protein
MDKHAELSNSKKVKSISTLQEQTSDADQPLDEAWSGLLRSIPLTNRKSSSFFQTSKQIRLVFKSNIRFNFIVFSYYTDDHPS